MHRRTQCLIGRVVSCLALLAAAMLPAAHAQITENNVLVLYNAPLVADGMGGFIESETTSKRAKDMYVAAYPGVRTFNFDDPALPESGGLGRTPYRNLVRDPLRDFLDGTTTGQDISSEVIVILTVRGLPARVNGADEFELFSSWGSLESELTLLWQDFESTAGTNSVLTTRYAGAIDNPYHRFQQLPITAFGRANIKNPRTFVANVIAPGVQVWTLDPPGVGQFYLAMRLDAAPTDTSTPELTEQTALEQIQRLITRTRNARMSKCEAQALLDEYPSGPPENQLDDDGLPPVIPGSDDFDDAAAVITGLGFDLLHDQTTNFVTGDELPDQLKQVGILGTYGENHNLNGWGANPPGQGTYVETYNLHPSAIFLSYESFNGNSIAAGEPRGNQEQVLDFITAGGSFAIGHVKEPFTFSVEDMWSLTQGLLVYGRTWAETAYAAMPVYHWQHTPVGNPLATITVLDTKDPDLNRDFATNAEDLYLHFQSQVDFDCNGAINDADTFGLRDAIRAGETQDVTTTAG